MPSLTKKATIAEAIEVYLDSVRLTRSENTARTYRNSLNAFVYSLEDNNLHINDTDGNKKQGHHTIDQEP